MTQKPMDAPSVADMHSAFRALSDAIVDNRDRKRDKPVGPLELISAADFAATTSEVWAMRSIASDPVGYFLRKGVKRVGQMIYDAEGMKGLHSAVEEIIRAEKHRPQYIAGVLDRALDGVGRDNDRWWS